MIRNVQLWIVLYVLLCWEVRPGNASRQSFQGKLSIKAGGRMDGNISSNISSISENPENPEIYTLPQMWQMLSLYPLSQELGNATFMRAGGESRVFTIATNCGEDLVVKRSLHPMVAKNCLAVQREAEIQSRVARAGPAPPILAITPCPAGRDQEYVDMLLELFDGDLKGLMRTPEVSAVRAAAKAGDEDAGRDLRRLWLSVLSDMADALDATHNAGYIHRDVKARNVLVRNHDRSVSFGTACLRGQCRYYLADFGRACLFGTTDCVYAMNTLGYMPPEVHKVDRKHPYHKVMLQGADYWALGLTLWELWVDLTPPDDWWYQTPDLPGIKQGTVESMEMGSFELTSTLLASLEEAASRSSWVPKIFPGDIQNLMIALLEPVPEKRLFKWPVVKGILAQMKQHCGVELPPQHAPHCITAFR